jgi:uncharacterized protein (TIGR02246 family)
MQNSFNRGDAKALAACWATDGEFIGPDNQRIIGRDKIEAAFQDFLKKHPKSKLWLGIAGMHPVTDDVIVVDLFSDMTPIPDGLDSEPISSAVLVRHNDQWLIGSIHETAGCSPSYRVHLKKLQWLIGHWTEDGKKSPNIAVQSDCDWNTSGAYLIRKFSVTGPSGKVVDGTEIVGWDPREHRIHSWTFKSDGSFGQSIWTQDGDRWTVAHTGTLPNGGDIAVTYIVTPVNDDTMTVASKDRRINGESQPALPEVTLKRSSTKVAPQTPSLEPPKHVLPK